MYAGCYYSNTMPSQLTPDCQEGFIVINDEIGLGKTMLVERLGSELDNLLGLEVLLARDLDEAHCIRGSVVNDVAQELARGLVAGRPSPQNGLTEVAISGQSSDYQKIAALERVVSRHGSIIKRAQAIVVELFGVGA